MADKLLQTEKEKQLETEAKLAAFRKTIAEAREAEAKAEKQATDADKAKRELNKDALKGPDVKALDGKITSTGNFIEAKILANKCLASLFDELVEKIKDDANFKNKEITFVIYNLSDLPTIEIYFAVLDQLSALKAIFTKGNQDANITHKAILEQDAAGGVAPLAIGIAAASILRTAADIFSLFKTNTTYSNYDIAVDESNVVTCFKCSLDKKKLDWKVFYPLVFPVEMFKKDNSNSDFESLWQEVKLLDNEAKTILNEIEDNITKIEEQLALETDENKKKKLKEKQRQLNKMLTNLQNTTSLFSELENMLLSVDQNTKMSIRAMMMRAERLINVERKPDTYVIKLTGSLNGSSQIKENLFRFSKVLHSGGANLSCMIFASNGSILFADNRRTYIPYTESADIASSSAPKSHS